MPLGPGYLIRKARKVVRAARRARRDAAAVRLIRQSGLFDGAWYLETYPDVAARGFDPVLHYVRYGADEGRDPNHLFSSTWYFTTYADVAAKRDNPLVDYIRQERSGQRNPSPLFNAGWYLSTNPDVGSAGLSPLLHYLRHGMREGRSPRPRDDITSWSPNSISIASPHAKDAQRATFDAARATRFVADTLASGGHARLLSERLLISIVLPTRNRATLLSTAIQSVLAQTYPHWELLIVDNGSTDDTAGVLAEFQADARIQVFHLPSANVAAARNLALAKSSGELIAYLDSDNAWRPDFLEVAAARLLDVDLDFIYAAIEADTGRHKRYVGAEFEFEALTRRNYIDINVVLHRRTLYVERGGCDESLQRMSDWDLILRYAKDSRIEYAPFIGCLYNARLTRSDRITVTEPISWLYVVLAKHHLDWSRLLAEVPARDASLASIIVPIHGQRRLAEQCLQSLTDADAGHPFELVLVDNGSDSDTAAMIDHWIADHPEVTLVRNWENLNFALGCSLGFAASRGATIVFLDSDTAVRPGWLSPLVVALGDERISAVQPKLLHPNGTVQSFGATFGPHGAIPYELYRGEAGDAPHVSRPRHLQMVTAACMAVRAIDFAAFRGFDPIFVNGEEGYDFCLRMSQKRPRTCLVEPASIVLRHEGSGPERNRFSEMNRRIFAARWSGKVQADDATTYAADGLAALDYRPDVPEWVADGLAAFRPRLARLKDAPDSPIGAAETAAPRQDRAP